MASNVHTIGLGLFSRIPESMRQGDLALAFWRAWHSRHAYPANAERDAGFVFGVIDYLLGDGVVDGAIY